MFTYFFFNEALPTNYIRLPLLSYFDVAFNEIEGSLPMFENVAQIYFRSNTFTGSIPTEYGLLEDLTELDLDYNADITGSVPNELVECDKLTLLSIRGTGISRNVTFCDSSRGNIKVILSDMSICGEECECCCVTSQ